MLNYKDYKHNINQKIITFIKEGLEIPLFSKSIENFDENASKNNHKKTGVSNFTFGEASIGNTYRLEGYLHQPEGGGLVITPKQNKIPKINKVELFYVDDTKGSTFSFKE